MKLPITSIYTELSEIDETSINILNSLQENQALRVLEEVRSTGRHRIHNLSAFIVSICRRIDRNGIEESSVNKRPRDTQEDPRNQPRQVPHFSNWRIMSILNHGQLLMPADLRYIVQLSDPQYEDEYLPTGLFNQYSNSQLDLSIQELLVLIPETWTYSY